MDHLKENCSLFPVEVDLSQNAFQYKSTAQINQDNQEDEEEIEYGKEIKEYHDICDEDTKDTKMANRRETKDKDDTDSSEQLLPGLTDISLTDVKTDTDNLTLLTELGLVDTNTSDDFGDFQNGLLDEFMPKGNDVTEDVFDKLLNDLCK